MIFSFFLPETWSVEIWSLICNTLTSGISRNGVRIHLIGLESMRIRDAALKLDFKRPIMSLRIFL
jgi:hypothetical protein